MRQFVLQFSYQVSHFSQIAGKVNAENDSAEGEDLYRVGVGPFCRQDICQIFSTGVFDTKIMQYFFHSKRCCLRFIPPCDIGIIAFGQ